MTVNTTNHCRLNNLSTADTVHILEPQWNPSVEKQAIGRVVRLGQTKKVTIVRYIMNKTIEGVSALYHFRTQPSSHNLQMIQGRQQWKLELVQNSFGNKNSKEAKQKTAEICVGDTAVFNSHSLTMCSEINIHWVQNLTIPVSVDPSAMQSSQHCLCFIRVESDDQDAARTTKQRSLIFTCCEC